MDVMIINKVGNSTFTYLIRNTSTIKFIDTKLTDIVTLENSFAKSKAVGDTIRL